MRRFGFVVRVPCLLAYQFPQQAVELGEDAVPLPLGEVAIDRLMGREVVREVGPLAACAVDVQDRVHDLAQVVPGRAPEVQSAAAEFEAPRGQHRLDESPAGIEQITRIRGTAGHDLDVLPVGGVRPGARLASWKHGKEEGVLE